MFIFINAIHLRLTNQFVSDVHKLDSVLSPIKWVLHTFNTNMQCEASNTKPLHHHCPFSCIWTPWAPTEGCTTVPCRTVQHAHSSITVVVSPDVWATSVIIPPLCDGRSICVCESLQLLELRAYCKSFFLHFSIKQMHHLVSHGTLNTTRDFSPV